VSGWGRGTWGDTVDRLRPCGSRAEIEPSVHARWGHLARRNVGEVGQVVGAKRPSYERGKRSTLTIADEHDVQDLVHALLLVAFEDVRAESWNPNYLGGASRVDFLVRDAAIVLEVKKTRDGLADREVGKSARRRCDPVQRSRGKSGRFDPRVLRL
jgi:hypothetical protein